MSDDDLRKKIKPFLVKKESQDEAVVDEFLQRVHYRYGNTKVCPQTIERVPI